MKFDFKICVHPSGWRYTLSVNIISIERYLSMGCSNGKDNLCNKSGWNFFPDHALEWQCVTLKGNKC